MIAEIWKAEFKIHDIYQSILKARTKEAREVYPGYQGWSILSEDGGLFSGWNDEAVVFNDKGEMDLEKSYARKKELGLINDLKHIHPTELMTPELERVVELVTSKGLKPCRMRISVLSAGSELYWHSDAPKDIYSVRLHIPLFTNDQAFFETENEREHFPANGDAYFIKVNQRHRVVNYGKTDRWHLIMDVTDTEGFTQFHSAKDK